MIVPVMVFCRLLLAAVFFIAGSAKLFDPIGTRKALRDFGVPGFLTPLLVVLLPLAELAVALAMIPAAFAWYGAWGALALLAVFLLAIAVAMVRGRTPDCHCFGKLHSAPISWKTWVRNGILAVCAGWVAAFGKANSGSDLWTWYSGLSTEESKFALVGVLVVAFLFLRIVLGARSGNKPAEAEPEVEAALEEEEADVPVEKHVQVAEETPAEALENNSAPRPAVHNIGLSIGAAAPEFELPNASGETRSLESLRAPGNDVLLVFLSPYCPPCMTLASNLSRWMKEMRGLPDIVLVSRGTAKDNQEKLKAFDPAHVLLQKKVEVAALYDCDTTPAAVLVGADGTVQSELANGAPAIKKILTTCVKRAAPEVKSTKASQRASALGG
jgi:peroxiredoxin